MGNTLLTGGAFGWTNGASRMEDFMLQQRETEPAPAVDEDAIIEVAFISWMESLYCPGATDRAYLERYFGEAMTAVYRRSFLDQARLHQPRLPLHEAAVSFAGLFRRSRPYSVSAKEQV